jgi:hypothetical protein
MRKPVNPASPEILAALVNLATAVRSAPVIFGDVTADEIDRSTVAWLVRIDAAEDELTQAEDYFESRRKRYHGKREQS